MKRYAASLKRAILVAPVLGLSLTAQQAFAGSIVYDPSNTCTTIDCSSTTINGTYNSSTSNSEPFVLQVFSSGNECVRLAVATQGTDLESTLVSPNGAIWKDDDGGGSLRPLIKANTNVRGWYTLQVSRYDGGLALADFTLRYGRYPSGNVNCSAATPPITTTVAPRMKATSGVPAEVPQGGPSDPDGI